MRQYKAHPSRTGMGLFYDALCTINLSTKYITTRRTRQAAKLTIAHQSKSIFTIGRKEVIDYECASSAALSRSQSAL